MFHNDILSSKSGIYNTRHTSFMHPSIIHQSWINSVCSLLTMTVFTLSTILYLHWHQGRQTRTTQHVQNHGLWIRSYWLSMHSLKILSVNSSSIEPITKWDKLSHFLQTGDISFPFIPCWAVLLTQLSLWSFKNASGSYPFEWNWNVLSKFGFFIIEIVWVTDHCD